MRVVVMGLWAAALSVLLDLSSRGMLTVLTPLPSVLLLLALVAAGVLADLVGVATTAARESALHAMAADRVPGARQGVGLVRHADRVASIANDLIGDVVGTLSGAVAAQLAVRLWTPGTKAQSLATTLLLALVAGLTVGGKAYAKRLALREPELVIAAVGRALGLFERLRFSRRHRRPRAAHGRK